MSKKKLLVIITLIFAVFSISFTVHHFKNKMPEIDNKKVKSDLKNTLSDVNSIENFKKINLELTERDKKMLANKFTKKVQAKKIGVSGRFNTTEVETNARYTMIYSYVNDNFKLVEIKEHDIDKWEYKPIGHVRTQSILRDLRKMKIGDFKKGYVGREKFTTIKIVDRKTNLEIGKDDIDVEITVKNNFAKTIIRAKLKYEFEKDNWILKVKYIEDKDNFKVEFITDNLPKQPTEQAIIDLLTDVKNQKTYMTNKKYTKKVYVSKPKIRAIDKTLIYDYLFVATYPNVGDIEYRVGVPYEYSDGEWIKKPITVAFNKALLTDMISKWGTGFNKDTKTVKEFLCFYKSENNELEGYYGLDGKKELIKAVVNIDLKDNNWTILVSPVAVEEGLQPICKLKEVSLNLKDRVIVGDNKNFEPKHKVTEKEISDFKNDEGEKLKFSEEQAEKEKDKNKESTKNTELSNE